jgi:2-phospho-L-lactate guanylyltransferase
MRIAVVPMKPLADAKARLGPALSPEERRTLSLAMLSDVVEATRGFARVWVLQSDADAAEVARAGGAEPRDDPAPGAGLNASLTAATAQAVAAGATGLLVVSADLPAALAEDLASVAGDSGVAVAPDSSGTGTNALWRSPADVVGVAFGPLSRAAHESAARDAGVPFRALDLPRLAADVDTPEGLAAAWALGLGPATRTAFERLGLASRLRLAG